jgi:Phage gp6-like head-tail connector protein
MAIDTRANVKTRNGITTSADDSLLDLLLESADAAIERFCRREFGTAVNEIEYFDGGLFALCLRNWSVDSITDIRIDALRVFGTDTILSTDNYVLYGPTGIVRSQWPIGPEGNLTVRVAYTWSNLPDEVKAAFAMIVGEWYRAVKTDVDRGQINVSQLKSQTQFAIYSGGIGERAFPRAAYDLLSPWRNRV